MIIPFEEAYWIVPGKVMAGPLPASGLNSDRRQLENLQSTGIFSIINLMEFHEIGAPGSYFPAYDILWHQIANENNNQVKVHRFPIPDHNIPTHDLMIEILNTIDSELENERPCYIHCLGGIGRTGVTVGCYMIRHNMVEPRHTTEMIRYLRRTVPSRYANSPETQKQREFILNWQQNL